MQIDIKKASIWIWAAVASLLLVAAILAGYAFFFREQSTTQDQACERIKQGAHGNVTPINDAVCAGAL